MKNLKNRYRYSLILLKELVKTDFKLRYQGSVLGYAWSLLRPLFLFLILYIVFANFLKFGDKIPHYPAYLLLGILLWNYFIEVTTGSVSAIVAKGDLIRKINFPKYVIVLSSFASAFINLLLTSIVMVAVLILSGISIKIEALLILPLVAELTLLALGFAFLLSAAYVKFRDVGYIWEVITQAAFYATPILYPLSLVPLAAQKILILNPVAQIIQDSREVLVTPASTTVGELYTENFIWALPIGLVLVIGIGSAAYFRSRSRYFAEEV